MHARDLAQEFDGLVSDLLSETIVERTLLSEMEEKGTQVIDLCPEAGAAALYAGSRVTKAIGEFVKRADDLASRGMRAGREEVADVLRQELQPKGGPDGEA